MSGYSYSQTPLVEGRAMPMTGREEGIGFGGNACYFSKAPQEDLADGSAASEPLYLVKLVSPIGAEFAVPAHWHPKTDEWWRVFIGSVDVTINGVTRTVTPADGEVHVPKGVVHALLVKKDVHTEFGERADPDPISKMRFLKLILGKGGQEAQLSPIQAMRLFYEDGDGYPSTGLKFVDTLMVNILGGFVGSFLGFGALPAAETAKSK